MSGEKTDKALVSSPGRGGVRAALLRLIQALHPDPQRVWPPLQKVSPLLVIELHVLGRV